MKKEIIQKLHTSFEDVAHEQEGVEFWLARDLQILLGYAEWRNFMQVIAKAEEACKNSGQNIADHFVEVNKMVSIKPEGLPPGKEAKKLEKRVRVEMKWVLKEGKKGRPGKTKSLAPNIQDETSLSPGYVTCKGQRLDRVSRRKDRQLSVSDNGIISDASANGFKNEKSCILINYKTCFRQPG